MPLRKLSRGKYEVPFIKLRQDIELAQKVKEQAAILSIKNDSIVFVEEKKKEIEKELSSLERKESKIEKMIRDGNKTLLEVENSKEDTVLKYFKIKREYESLLKDINKREIIKNKMYEDYASSSNILNKNIKELELRKELLKTELSYVNRNIEIKTKEIEELNISKNKLEEDNLKLKEDIRIKDQVMLEKDIRIDQLTEEVINLMTRKDVINKNYK